MEQVFQTTLLAFEYLFLLRYNLILLAAFWLIVWGSRRGGALAPMFGGMFELSHMRAGAVAAAGSMFACFLILTSNMVIRHASARFGIAAVPDWLGYLIAVLAVAGVLALAYRLIKEAYCSPSTRIPAACGLLLGPAIAIAGFGVRDYIPVNGLLTYLFSFSPEGFLTAAGQPIVDHVILVYVAAAYFAAYLALGYWTGSRIRSGGILPVPSLGWVMAILLLGVLFLNAFSFYLDKFHIGLVPALFILGWLWMNTLGGRIVEHHTFRAYPIPAQRLNAKRPIPSQLLRRAGGKAVIVCASGGGIHAAAWATALLGEISTRVPHFAKHLVLTSSVSGGSVGCLYYLASLRAKITPTADRLFEVASTSSLDHICWGFGFRDLLRFFLPVGRLFHWGNRAWALEKAWSRYPDFPVQAPLSELTEDVALGKIPGSIFNSTIVETGDRFAISTVDLVTKAKDTDCRREFAHLYPGLDLPGTTAAGLSAAFPIVSPSSHIWVHPDANASPSPDKAYHLTDGGFYDNYGVVSAIEFLERGRRELAATNEPMPEVLIIRIRGEETQVGDSPGKDSILFQLKAPFKALLSMRSTSQVVRNNVELGLLTSCLGLHDASGNPCLTCIDFAYPKSGTPLSWTLTNPEKEELLASLKDPTIDANLQRVANFLAPKQSATHKDDQLVSAAS